jgi:hypothetical protein
MMGFTALYILGAETVLVYVQLYPMVAINRRRVLHASSKSGRSNMISWYELLFNRMLNHTSRGIRTQPGCVATA